MLTPSDIVEDVEIVLRNAARGDGDHPNFLTAYQILSRLPQRIRDRLIEERSIGGEGAGAPYAAPTVIAQAAEMLRNRGRVIIDYIDSRGLLVEVAGQQRRPSFEVCAIYRFRAEAAPPA